MAVPKNLFNIFFPLVLRLNLLLKHHLAILVLIDGVDYWVKKPNFRKGSYPGHVRETTDKEFVGDGWSVLEGENGNFYFEFVSGAMQGKNKKREISKRDYELARAGKINFDELCRKYE